MSLQDQLLKFRESFFSVYCLVEEDYVVYKTRRGFARSLAQEANDLIDRLNLNLTAIPTSLSADDSFCVKSSETPDI